MVARAPVGEEAGHRVGRQVAHAGAAGGAVAATATTGDETADHVVAHRDLGDPRPDRLHDPRALVSGHHGVARLQVAVDEVQVGVAEAGGDEPHVDLARAGLVDLQLADLELLLSPRRRPPPASASAVPPVAVDRPTQVRRPILEGGRAKSYSPHVYSVSRSSRIAGARSRRGRRAARYTRRPRGAGPVGTLSCSGNAAGPRSSARRTTAAVSSTSRGTRSRIWNSPVELRQAIEVEAVVAEHEHVLGPATVTRWSRLDSTSPASTTSGLPRRGRGGARVQVEPVPVQPVGEQQELRELAGQGHPQLVTAPAGGGVHA